MNILLTPKEVVDLAYNTPETISSSLVSESTILAAQYKFIRPALGHDLYNRVAQGDYPELCNGYIKPALAIYVRLLMLPMLVSQTGSTGIVQHHSDNFSTADRTQISALRQGLRSDALAMLRRALEHIECNAERYPQYDPRNSILNIISISGNIII